MAKAAKSAKAKSSSKTKKTTKSTKATKATKAKANAKVGTEPAEERRKLEDRREQDAECSIDRRKVQRRRQIDPTTCERDYTDDEIEFMRALDEYKRANGRMFPTCSEILEVIRALGYERVRMGDGFVVVDNPASDAVTDGEDGLVETVGGGLS